MHQTDEKDGFWKQNDQKFMNSSSQSLYVEFSEPS